MKKIIIGFVLVLSFSTFAEEIPIEQKLKNFQEDPSVADKLTNQDLLQLIILVSLDLEKVKNKLDSDIHIIFSNNVKARCMTKLLHGIKDKECVDLYNKLQDPTK